MLKKPPLAAPPRAIPTSLRYRVLLGGIWMMIGWPMLAFGGLLSTVFVGNSEIATWYRFATELATTQGIVVGSEATNMRNNRDEVLLVEFTYSVNAQDYRARSFTQQQPPEDDAVVTIEYAVNKPENARIGGMRSAPFPAVAGLTLIAPSVAIVLLLIGYLRGRKKLRLMRDGTSVWGLLTDRQPTNTRINNQRVYRLTFSFVDDSGKQRTATDRSHRSEFFNDQVARHVLWDRHSRDSCIAELITGKPKIGDGAWQPISNARIALLFVLPAIAFTAIYAASHITV